MSIKVNISGRYYEIPKEVLQRSQMFRSLMEDCVIDGEIKVARSAKLFEHVYSFLVSPAYPYPKKYSAELDYYLIDYDIRNLYDSDAINLQNNNEICRLKTFVYDLSDELAELKIAVNDLSDQVVYLKKALTHQVPEGYELGESCKYLNCTKECMLPVCEYHRGRCCHSYGDYACDKYVSDNEVYCDVHTKNY